MLVREAWAKYHSPVDYGITGLDLPKVAALIAAGMPTRLYYTSYRNNAFDTHVYQNDTHKRLLTYASDAVSAFLSDLERIGRADDVVVMIFSEFGRRVPENVNLGTDHGAANLMFVAGKQVKGGQYGAIPSLTKLDAGDNLIYTTDFRRVYATMIDGWLGLHDTRQLLNGDFETFEDVPDKNDPEPIPRSDLERRLASGSSSTAAGSVARRRTDTVRRIRRRRLSMPSGAARDRDPRRPPVRQQDRPDADETGGGSCGRAHHRGRTGGASQDSGGSAGDRPEPGDRAARPDRRAYAHVQHARRRRGRPKPPC